MRRRVVQQLLALQGFRGIQTGAATLHNVPVGEIGPFVSSGRVSGLAPARDASAEPKRSPFDGKAPARLTTPLTQPLPGLAQREPHSFPHSSPPTEITVLPNGVRIISEATPVSKLMAWEKGTAWVQ